MRTLNVLKSVRKYKTVVKIKNLNVTRKLHSVRTIQIPNLYIEECIWNNLNKWHHKTAMVCAETNRSYTFLDIYKKSNSLSAFLHKFGITKSDTAAIILPNVLEYGIILLGSIQAGLNVTTINPSFSQDEINKQLILSNTKLIFTTYALYHTILQTMQSARLQIPVVVVKTQSDPLLPRGAISLTDILENKWPNFQPSFQRNWDDTAIIPFSSGTTGYPKGVELTHKNVVSGLHQISSTEFDILTETNGSDQDVFPVILPLYHIYGLHYKLLHGLFKGCKLVIVPKFTSAMFINLLENVRPTVFGIVPPICHMVINSERVKQSHFEQIRCIVSGGAPLSSATIIALSEKIGRQTRILQGYGMTESTALTNVQTSSIKNGIKNGGVGLVLPSTEVKVVLPEKEQEVGSNVEGEILARGPQIMKGYYKNDKETKEAFTHDGWLKTGDLGYYDDDGHFFITGRIKELIKVNAFQVAPAELEDLIRAYPGVEDVTVIGVPHGAMGEAPKAFVVRKPKSNVTSTSIEEYVKKKVVYYKQLTGGVSFIDAIPKSASGKTLKKLLKNL